MWIGPHQAQHADTPSLLCTVNLLSKSQEPFKAPKSTFEGLSKPIYIWKWSYSIKVGRFSRSSSHMWAHLLTVSDASARNSWPSPFCSQYKLTLPQSIRVAWSTEENAILVQQNTLIPCQDALCQGKHLVNCFLTSNANQACWGHVYVLPKHLLSKTCTCLHMIFTHIGPHTD